MMVTIDHTINNKDLPHCLNMPSACECGCGVQFAVGQEGVGLCQHAGRQKNNCVALFGFIWWSAEPRATSCALVLMDLIKERCVAKQA
jgi:hypothetical protein